MIIKFDWALEVTAAGSQPLLPPLQSRHLRAARASQIHTTERSSFMSARPHRPDTIVKCQRKQETVSAAQMGKRASP